MLVSPKNSLSPSGGSSAMEAPAASMRISPRAWTIVVLCGFAGMFFYMDRATLSVLKTTLKGEMGWTDTDYGWLVTTFMLFYTGCYLFSGRWLDRWGTRWTMPIFIGAMSAATLCSGLARNLGEMAASRALLGIAEAGVMPAIMVAIFHWVPPNRRGLASTIKEPLYVAGQILATPLAVWFTHRWSWHAAFFIPGMVGLLVAAAWWFTDDRKRGPLGTKATALAAPSPVPVSYGQILRRREIWGVIAARCVSDPLWFFLIYWEPGFLQERLGLSLSDLGRVGWIPTTAATGALLVFGPLSDWLVSRRGWRPARSRRVILQTLACLAPAVLALHYVSNVTVAIVLLCVVRVMAVTWLNFTNILMADLVPQKSIGTSVALMSAVGAATGMLCNSVVGPILSTVGYGVIFAIGAFLHPIAALILWRVYGKTASGPGSAAPATA
ncbi:MAG: MFS transporter [Opitutus sp.]